MEIKDDLISRREALDDISKMHGVMYPDHNLKYISQDIVLSTIKGLPSRMTAAEAWEIARKMLVSQKKGGISIPDFRAIFGYISVSDVLSRYTPEEAKAKIEAWKNRLKVGDIVRFTDGDVAVITFTNLDTELCGVLFQNGDTGDFPVNGLRKTGKTIDIQGILDQLGE